MLISSFLPSFVPLYKFFVQVLDGQNLTKSQGAFRLVDSVSKPNLPQVHFLVNDRLRNLREVFSHRR